MRHFNNSNKRSNLLSNTIVPTEQVKPDRNVTILLIKNKKLKIQLSRIYKHNNELVETLSQTNSAFDEMKIKYEKLLIYTESRIDDIDIMYKKLIYHKLITNVLIGFILVLSGFYLIYDFSSEIINPIN
jgi:hypothetical protein